MSSSNRVLRARADETRRDILRLLRNGPRPSGDIAAHFSSIGGRVLGVIVVILIDGLSVVLGRLGMMRVVARAPGPAPKDWTPEEWDTLARLRRQRGALLADAHEGPEPERATADLVRSAGGLKYLPLIVLTQGRTPESGDSVERAKLRAVHRGWIELQRHFAQRSRRGRQIIVASSGHGIAVEAPAAVVSAVRQLVTELRDSRN